MTLHCDRGDTYNSSLSLTEEHAKDIKSRLIDCPFELYVARHNDLWHLEFAMQIIIITFQKTYQYIQLLINYRGTARNCCSTGVTSLRNCLTNGAAKFSKFNVIITGRGPKVGVPKFTFY
jgi:hypothetical protein